MGLVLWCQNQPISTVLGGEVTREELSQFSPVATLRLPVGSLDDAGLSQAERSILAMQPYTLCEIVQDGVGTIAFGRVLSPTEAITDRDEHTITLELQPLASELTERRTGVDFKAQNYLAIVFNRLATMVSGWTTSFLDIASVDPTTGQPDNFIAQVTLANPSILGGVLTTAQRFGQYVRMAVNPVTGSPSNSDGTPIRQLEVGQMGAGPVVTLQDAKGGDPDEIAKNPNVRLILSIERHPNDVTDLQTVVTPYGGGQDIDSAVTLKRLWEIINDPTNPDYLRYGSNAQSQFFTGKDSLFPEYDPNYPISDPENLPDGRTLYLMPAGNIVAANQPLTVQQILDQGGALLQGATGTRVVTEGGRFAYTVYDPTAFATYGYKEPKDYTDSTLNYTSNNPADQQYTARALYISAVTYLKKYAHPHHMLTVTTASGTWRPPRAGDFVAVDYQHGAGAQAGMNVVETLRVMKVVTTFPDDGSPPTDTYTLSNLGRFDQDDASQAAADRGTIVALQRQQGTGLAPYTRDYAGNIDAANPITINVYVPKLHFRWHEFRVQCDFFPFRGTATTALNQSGQHIVTVGGIDIVIPASADLGFSDSYVSDPQGFAADLRLHVYGAQAGAHQVYADFLPGPQANVLHTIDGTSWDILGIFAKGRTSGVSLTTTDTTHTGKTKVAATLAKRGDTIAHIPAGTALADLPLHAHDVEKRIPTGTPSPASIALAIAGAGLSSGAATTGTRRTDGAFTSAFVVTDCSAAVEAAGAPGTVVPLTFTAGTNASNPFGVGWLQISVTAVEELGGLSSTVQAS